MFDDIFKDFDDLSSPDSGSQGNTPEDYAVSEVEKATGVWNANDKGSGWTTGTVGRSRPKGWSTAPTPRGPSVPPPRQEPDDDFDDEWEESELWEDEDEEIEECGCDDCNDGYGDCGDGIFDDIFS